MAANTSRQQTTRSTIYIVIVILLATVSAGASIWMLSDSKRLHAQIQRNLVAPESYVQHVHLTAGERAITLMKNRPFRVNTPWMYVSESAPLPKDYKPINLTAIAVPQMRANERFKLEKRTNIAIGKLFKAANKDSRSLIVSSAYRSNADQKAIYDSSLAQYGATYTSSHVADPGTSEHATGYAVDINSYSRSCELTGSGCSLSTSDAAWLARVAPSYGFILRYPEGKESETGVSYEPWHFRYVGDSAGTITGKLLTLDRFVINVTTGKYERITSH